MLYSGSMPQVTVYIRQGDLPKWKAIPKKTEFIHNALKEVPMESLPTHTLTPKEHLVSVLPKSSFEAVLNIPGIQLGSEIDEFACCTKPNHRCKHWEFDPKNNNWTNTHTGEVKDATLDL